MLACLTTHLQLELHFTEFPTLGEKTRISFPNFGESSFPGSMQ